MDTKAVLACVIAVVGMLAVGCSDTPIAPTSTPVVAGATPGTTPAPPAPTPAPAPPAPTPAPPAPTPNPPAPAPIAVYLATTVSATWTTPPPALPEKFTVEVFDETVAFGPLRLPVKSRAIVQKDLLGIIAGDDDLVVVMERVQVTETWRWTLAGKSGQAFGYMTAQQR